MQNNDLFKISLEISVERRAAIFLWVLTTYLIIG